MPAELQLLADLHPTSWGQLLGRRRLHLGGMRLQRRLDADVLERRPESQLQQRAELGSLSAGRRLHLGRLRLQRRATPQGVPA
jgi:hypothetical protein